MSRLELQRELAREHVFVDGMVDGITKKYAKKMKVVGESCLLGITKYTNPTTRNTMWVVWYKEWNGHFNDICYSYFIEYLDDRTRNWLLPLNGSHKIDPNGENDLVLIYTQHALERLKERAGLDFQGFIRESLNQRFRVMRTTYEYNGVESTGIALGNKGLFLLDKGVWGTVCKTFVSADLLGESQNASMEESIDGTNEFGNRLDQDFYARADKFYKGLSRSERRKIKKISAVA